MPMWCKDVFVSNERGEGDGKKETIKTIESLGRWESCFLEAPRFEEGSWAAFRLKFFFPSAISWPISNRVDINYFARMNEAQCWSLNAREADRAGNETPSRLFIDLWLTMLIPLIHLKFKEQ